MAEPSLTLEMLIKEGKAIIGLERVAAAQTKVEKSAANITKEAKRGDAELDRFVKRMQQITATPLEKLRVEMAQLETAFARGKIGVLDYAKAHQHLRQAQESLNGTAAKLQEQAKLAQWLAGVKAKSVQLEYAENVRIGNEKKNNEKRIADEQAKMAQWLAGVKAKSVQLEYSENVRLGNEKKANDKRIADEQAKLAQWLAGVKINSAKLEASENKRIQKDKLDYAAIAAARDKEYDDALAVSAKRGAAIYTAAVKQRVDADKKAAAAHKESLANNGFSQIAQLAAGYFTLSRAVNTVGDAFRHAKEESQGALGSMRGLDDGRKKLAQLATDMPAGSLAKMQSRADAASMASGASRSTAYEVLFQSHSFGFEKDYERVMGMHPLIDANAVSSIAGKVNQMTGGKSDPRKLVNQLIEAGKPSEVDAETLAGPMAIALEGGRRINANPEETMALLSVLTTYYAGRGEVQGEGKTGAARVAGDRIRAFGHKVATRLPHLRDKGFIGSFEAVRTMPESERAEFLQENEEIASAYESYLAGRNRLGGVMGQIKRAGDVTGTSGDNVARGLAIRAADPKSRAVMTNARAKLRQEVATENNLGISFANADAASSEAQALAHRTGLNFWQRFGVYMGSGTAANIGMSPEATLSAGKWGGNLATVLGGGIYGGGGIHDFIPAMKRLEAADKQKDAAVAQEAAAAAMLDAAHLIIQAMQGNDTRSVQAAAQATLN